MVVVEELPSAFGGSPARSEALEIFYVARVGLDGVTSCGSLTRLSLAAHDIRSVDQTAFIAPARRLS